MKEINDVVVTINAYDDLESVDDLGERDREAIAQLATNGDITPPFGAVWLPEWLAEEKSLKSVDGTYRVFRGHFTEATEKAIRVYQRDAEAWVPKSQAHAFAAPAGVTIESPTKTLDAWGDA